MLVSIRRCRAVLSGTVVSSWLAFGSIALAAEAEPSVLQYEAPAGCPGRAAFESAVRQRLNHGRLARPGEAGPVYRVALTVDDGASHALLEVLEGQNRAPVRELLAEGCEEAMKAIALVTALAIEARVHEAPPESSRPASASGIPAGPPPLQPPAPPPPPLSQVEVEQRAPPPDVVDADDAFRFEIGARGTLTTPKAPSVLLGGEIFGEVGTKSWLVALGLRGERGGREAAGTGEARFSFVGARLEGCPLALRPSAGFSLMPCAFAETGAVIAEGFIAEPETVVDAYLGLGAALRARLSWGRLDVDVDAGPTLNVNHRDRYVFSRGTPRQEEIHDVPLVGLFLALGVGWNML